MLPAVENLFSFSCVAPFNIQNNAEQYSFSFTTLQHFNLSSAQAAELSVNCTMGIDYRQQYNLQESLAAPSKYHSFLPVTNKWRCFHFSPSSITFTT
jgi:hypothetical protein